MYETRDWPDEDSKAYLINTMMKEFPGMGPEDIKYLKDRWRYTRPKIASLR